MDAATGEDIQPRRRVLATDLDGTFIPLDGHQQHREDLRTLASQIEQRGIQLIYVTGRHLGSILTAIRNFQLPRPRWIISDVGTSIYSLDASDGRQYEVLEEYSQTLRGLAAGTSVVELRERLASFSELVPQPDVQQGEFKLSYYCPAERLSGIASAIQVLLTELAAPYSLVHSVDPFTGDGLLDLLPQGVNKSFALDWWTRYLDLDENEVVFAGDSGNDLAALTAGYAAILVANAERKLARQVYDHHRSAGTLDRLFLASRSATSGVLEGARWFRLIPFSTTSADATCGTGVSLVDCETTYFRVWAPNCQQVEVEIDSESTTRYQLRAGKDGFYSGQAPARVASHYQFVLDGDLRRPDPASCFQPQGVHGPSMIVDQRFPWTDGDWQGISKRDMVLYEVHVGALTKEGTYRAALEELPRLVELGITAVELMPVAQSPGRWNWGYDGVNLFAPRNTYGTPQDLKAFVDKCHELGLAVILDVVYNHLGPEGNYLTDFGPYSSTRHHTPWGDALNLDAAGCEQVRQYILENALYWLRDFHFDGLRLDAVHFILDDSRPSILDELRKAVSTLQRDLGRQLHLIAESNIYDEEFLTATEDRAAFDAIWCDCLMHSLYAHSTPDLKLTPRSYLGRQEIAEALDFGFLYQMEAGQRRRLSTDERTAKLLPWQQESLVVALQTHDAVGNHPEGKRIHQVTSIDYQRAAVPLVLLYPAIPLIFMGEESASNSPFPFFVDFEDPRLRDSIDAARAREYPQHTWAHALSPSDPNTFLAAKCQLGTESSQEMRAWYGDLLRLRRQGLAEGWLAFERMNVGYCSQDDVIRLSYLRDDGKQLVVAARLSSAESALEVDDLLVENVLLGSRETPQSASQVVLQPIHTVIAVAQ